MKAFFAGICLFFSTLVSCQQKGEDFESVSTDEFATLIADPDIQRLGCTHGCRIFGRTYSGQYQYQCVGRTVCCYSRLYTSKG